jgi:hypothetical protein
LLCGEKQQHGNYNESYWSHRGPDMVPPVAGRDKRNFGSAKTAASSTLAALLVGCQ